MAIKSFAAIAQSIINNISTVNPIIDVKIGSVVRDIFIDVQASELQTLYAMLDYSSQAQSILTARGTQLDRLAYNYLQTRDSSKRSVGAVTLVIKSGITAPTLLNVGDQFFTGTTQSGQTVTFVLAQAFVLPIGITQVTVPVISMNPGKNQDVPALTIVNSNYDFVDEVYNSAPTSGGDDQETDATFAARIPVSLTGQFVNVFNGIIHTLFSVDNVKDSNPLIITPDNPNSRGPYTVDVYIQPLSTYFGTPVTETAPANTSLYAFKQQPLYQLNPINQITYVDPSSGNTIVVGAGQYTIILDPTDVFQDRVGSIRAKQQLKWLGVPPVVPYLIDYNVDQTIIDAQGLFDAKNEVVSDTLFRQSNPIPVYIGANLSTLNSANFTLVNQNASTNILNAFASLSINDGFPLNGLIFSFLSDRNVTNAQITNFDTAIEVTLTGTPNGSGGYTFAVTAPTSNYLANHVFTPLGLYYDNTPSSSVFQPFSIAGRLFLGNPLRITPSGTNIALSFQPAGTGVISRDLIQGVSTSWNTNVDTYYDARTQTLAINFDTAPTGTAPTITFNIVQPDMIPLSGINYLALAPSLIQPIVPLPIPNNIAVLQPPFVTVLPSGLPADRANVYKNGLILTAGTSNTVGDYTISLQNGVYTIIFTTTPQTSDVLVFGLLNPSLSISIS